MSDPTKMKNEEEQSALLKTLDLLIRNLKDRELSIEKERKLWDIVYKKKELRINIDEIEELIKALEECIKKMQEMPTITDDEHATTIEDIFNKASQNNELLNREFKRPYIEYNEAYENKRKVTNWVNSINALREKYRNNQFKSQKELIIKFEHFLNQFAEEKKQLREWLANEVEKPFSYSQNSVSPCMLDFKIKVLDNHRKIDIIPENFEKSHKIVNNFDNFKINPAENTEIKDAKMKEDFESLKLKLDNLVSSKHRIRDLLGKKSWDTLEEIERIFKIIHNSCEKIKKFLKETRIIRQSNGQEFSLNVERCLSNLRTLNDKYYIN